MGYDFSKPETKQLFEQEVTKRMAEPFRMSRSEAEMLVAMLMWEDPENRQYLVEKNR